MADETYVVETVYRTTGLEAITPMVRTAAGVHDLLAYNIDRTKSGFSDLTKQVLAMGAAYASLGTIKHLTHEVIRLGAEAETTRIAIGSMLQLNKAVEPGEAGFVKSLAMADAIITRMRVHARDLPGTFNDLMAVFRPVLQSSTGAGKSVNQIEEFSARAMAAAKSMQISPHTMGSELAMMMQGRVSHAMPLWRQMQQLIPGMSHGKWHGMDQGKRFEAISDVFQRMQPAMKEFEKTWDAVSSTTQDWIDHIKRVGGKALFEEFKKPLIEINDYLASHREEIEQLATVVGRDLADGFKQVAHWIKEGVGFLIEHKDAVMAFGGVLAYRSALGKFGGGFMNADSRSWSDIVSDSKDAAGVGDARKKLRRATRRLGTPDGDEAYDEAEAGLEAAHKRAKAAQGEFIRETTKAAVQAGIFGVALGRINSGPMREHGQLLSLLNDAISGVSGAMSALPGKLGVIGEAVTLIWNAAKAFYTWAKKDLEKQKQEARSIKQVAETIQGSGPSIRDLTGTAAYLQQRGMLKPYSEAGDITSEALTADLRSDTQTAFDFLKGKGLINDGNIDVEGVKGMFSQAYAPMGDWSAYGVDSFSTIDEGAKRFFDDLIEMARINMSLPKLPEDDPNSVQFKKVPDFNQTNYNHFEQKFTNLDENRVYVDTKKALREALLFPVSSLENLAASTR